MLCGSSGVFWECRITACQNKLKSSSPNLKYVFSQDFSDCDHVMQNIIFYIYRITQTSRSSGTTGSSNQRTSYCSIDLGETFLFMLRIAMKMNIYLTAWRAGAQPLKFRQNQRKLTKTRKMNLIVTLQDVWRSGPNAHGWSQT